MLTKQSGNPHLLLQHLANQNMGISKGKLIKPRGTDRDNAAVDGLLDVFGDKTKKHLFPNFRKQMYL